MTSRGQAFLIFFNMVFILLGIRLFSLQVIDFPKYSKLSSDNAARLTPILAPRGIVFDRNGKVVLKNKPVFMVYIIPHLLPDNRDPVFAKLAGIMGVDRYELERRFAERKRPIFEGILIARDISTSLATKIEEAQRSLPGVEVICYPFREYPYHGAAAHTLGYVREIGVEELATLKDKGYRL